MVEVIVNTQDMKSSRNTERSPNLFLPNPEHLSVIFKHQEVTKVITRPIFPDHPPYIPLARDASKLFRTNSGEVKACCVRRVPADLLE
jgi:hypothetical protein